MALQPILQGWKQELDGNNNPSIESLRQALQNTLEQVGQVLGLDVETLKTLIYFMDELQVDELHDQIVENEVHAGQNQNDARVEAALRIRNEISEFLGDIVFVNNQPQENDNVVMDGGKKRRKTQKKRK